MSSSGPATRTVRGTQWNSRDLKTPFQPEESDRVCRLACFTVCDQYLTEGDPIGMEISTWWDITHIWKPNQVTGTTRHLLLFNNCLSIALHLLHNDLFFFWQQDLRNTLFPHCTQIKRKLGFKSPSAAEGLPDESRRPRQTCGVLVQAGTRAVSLDHPQYLSIFLQSNCAYHRRKHSLSSLKKSHAASWRVGLKCWFLCSFDSTTEVVYKKEAWWDAQISLPATAQGYYI